MRKIPFFIDNKDSNTLAQALSAVLSQEKLETPDQIRIASAFFSPTGFAHIADQLIPIKKVRLLLGTDLTANSFEGQKKLDETSSAFEKRCLTSGLRRIDNSLKRERDCLTFTRTNSFALRKLINALQAGNMEVRRYEKAFLHAKAYIFTATDVGYKELAGVIAGSSNLTGAGLTSNLELNLGRFDQATVEKAIQWFDDLWEEAEDYDLAELFEEAFIPRTPWEIFVRVLWQLYGDEILKDETEDNNLPLTSFQKHGVARALRLIRDTGGAIVADEVGLGKTFIAGEILQLYNDRRHRVLLVCPAALRDSTWGKFISDYRLFVECLSFEQLANDVQLRASSETGAVGKPHLQRPLEEYQLVIVDEAHNYRNPNAPTRAGTLRRLLGGKRRDLLLLTATPVNNSLWDLYHLLRFFLRQDSHLASRGILSIRTRFEEAMCEDPSSLNPDLLYPIIDATTVKRTREFVKKHYSGDTIPGPDGQPRPIVFPKPRAISVHYSLEDRLPGFLDLLEKAVDPDSDHALKFARYMPDNYLLDDENEEKSRTQSMVGLLRSGMLKRFESSAFAFLKTVENMMKKHDVFLDALDAGHVVTTEFIQEISGDDETLFEYMLNATDHSNDATLYDTDRLREDVQWDRNLLQELTDEARKITPDRDPKLEALLNALVEIANQAEKEAVDSSDEAQKRKVLVFSFFEDTAEQIWKFLNEEIEKHPELKPYKNRMQVVTGSGDLGKVSRQQAVEGFVPISMRAPNRKKDLYDLLVCTDVLAEGVNLQQCRHIINFDMPWNPMRLVQRHGRIDRIGSPHNRVFLRTIFPADRLDRLLNLNQRILGKLAMAAASVGVSQPIEGAAYGTQVFSETREEIEKLLKEDPSLYERGGTVGAAQTGEEYRQTLRKALGENRNRIVQMPWKSGSGMMKGSRRGFFFCAVAGEGTKLERNYLRFVPADGNWQPQTVDNNNAIEDELGTCLRLIECEETMPTWSSDILWERVYDFWEIAQKNILTCWMKETDPANLQPRVRPLNHRVAKFIRDNMPRDMSQDQVIKSLDILESPWPRREETMLRAWFDSSGHESVALSRFLVKQILDTGLEPVKPPMPLPVIELEDIKLVCWMGIESENCNSVPSSL